MGGSFASSNKGPGERVARGGGRRESGFFRSGSYVGTRGSGTEKTLFGGVRITDMAKAIKAAKRDPVIREAVARAQRQARASGGKRGGAATSNEAARKPGSFAAWYHGDDKK